MSSLVQQLNDGRVVAPQTIQDRVSRAKVRLLMSDPFTASLLITMPVIYTETLPTMATDGKHLYINPSYVDGLTAKELEGVFTHETFHKICMHHIRRGNMEPFLFNVAGDIVINELITKDGKVLPEGALGYHTLDEQGIAYEGRNHSTEQVYGLFKNKPDQRDDPQGGPGDDEGDEGGDGDGEGEGESGGGQVPDGGTNGTPGPGTPGDGTPTPGPFDDDGGTGIVIDATNDDGSAMSEADKAMAERETMQDIFNAATIAKGQGKLPASVEAWVESLRTPTVDWKDQLDSFIGGGGDHANDWNRLDKKMSPRGLLSPRRTPKGCGQVVVAVDTSYSTHATYPLMMAELLSICEDAAPDNVTIIYCDTQIAKVDSFDDPEDITAQDIGKFGGGGTSFEPPFKYVEDNDLDVDSFIYLTDLECGFPNEPDYPVLWASTTAEVAPWGKTIHVKP